MRFLPLQRGRAAGGGAAFGKKTVRKPGNHTVSPYALTGGGSIPKPGMVTLAHRGVLFLDEITNMPLDMQAKLLRVLQERQAVRIGGSDPIAFDVQVIAATNKDIISEIERKNFRLDLFTD